MTIIAVRRLLDRGAGGGSTGKQNVENAYSTRCGMSKTTITRLEKIPPESPLPFADFAFALEEDATAEGRAGGGGGGAEGGRGLGVECHSPSSSFRRTRC